MRIVILGGGAIGGVIAGQLQRAGRSVVLLARGAQLEVIRKLGLQVESPDATFVSRPPTADSGQPFDWRPEDVLLLAVKTQDVAGGLRTLAPPPEIPIVCLTNGVEAERIALRHARHVYGAFVWVQATYLVPGLVQVWAGPVLGAIEIGRVGGGLGEHATRIAAELERSGFATRVRPDIMRWKRGKLLWSLLNGAEALCGPSARLSEIAALARGEAVACFDAAGLTFATDAEQGAYRERFAPRPIRGVSRAGGSTWQSLARGATVLETDYLNGEIALLGRQHDVATPVNEALQRLAAEAARGARAAGTMPVAELVARVARRQDA